MILPVIAEPLNVATDGCVEVCLFFSRIGVVQSEVATPREFLRKAEIQNDGFRVTEMEVAVWFRRKPGHNKAMPASDQIICDDIADEVTACGVCSHVGIGVSEL